jgi:hypothetical protein
MNIECFHLVQALRHGNAGRIWYILVGDSLPEPNGEIHFNCSLDILDGKKPLVYRTIYALVF